MPVTCPFSNCSTSVLGPVVMRMVVSLVGVSHRPSLSRSVSPKRRTRIIVWLTVSRYTPTHRAICSCVAANLDESSAIAASGGTLVPSIASATRRASTPGTADAALHNTAMPRPRVG